MQCYASCLLPSLLRCCSCLLFLCRSHLVLQLILLCQLVCCFRLLQTYFTVHAGIAGLYCAWWDSISDSPTYDWSQMHAGIVCLASLACDWVITCWDSLPILLQAGIACLASLAYDWVIASWDSLAALSMLGQHVYLPWPMIGWLHAGIACLYLHARIACLASQPVHG